jgi:hypothetical protein
MPVDLTERTVAPTTSGKRTVYSIEVCVNGTDGNVISFNEFALNETEATAVHELLNINGNEPVEVNGVTYKRRPLSAKKSSFAEKKAELLAARAAATP